MSKNRHSTVSRAVNFLRVVEQKLHRDDGVFHLLYIQSYSIKFNLVTRYV